MKRDSISAPYSKERASAFSTFIVLSLVVFLGLKISKLSSEWKSGEFFDSKSEIVEPVETVTPPRSEYGSSNDSSTDQASVKGMSDACEGSKSADSFEFLCKASSTSVNISDGDQSGGDDDGDVVTITKDCEIEIEEVQRPVFENGGDLNGDGLIQIEYGEWPSYADFASGGGTNYAQYTSSGESKPSSKGRLAGCGYSTPGCSAVSDGSSSVKHDMTLNFTDQVEFHLGEVATDDCAQNPPTTTTVYQCKTPKLSDEMSPEVAGRFIAPLEGNIIIENEPDVLQNSCDRLSPMGRVAGTSDGVCVSGLSDGGWLGFFKNNYVVSTWETIINGVKDFLTGVKCVFDGSCAKDVTIKILIKKSPSYATDLNVTSAAAPDPSLPEGAGYYEDTLVQTDCYVNACGKAHVRASCIYVDYRVPAWEDYTDDNFCLEKHPWVIDESGSLVEDYRYNTCILSDYISYVNNTVDRCVELQGNPSEAKSDLELEICSRVLGKSI